MNYKLNILCQTWNKESNLLFDYDTNEYTLSHLEIRKPGDLTQVDKKVEYTTNSTKSIGNYITTVDIKGDKFIIKLNEKKEAYPVDERMWIVIRNLTTKGNLGYQLREGDLIKFGKVMFKIKEICILNSRLDLDNKTHCEKANECNNDWEKSSKTKKGVMPACRICLIDDATCDNPLISPCTCIGSVRFVHLLCLRQWHKSKMNIKTFNVLVVHSFKTFECEICKTPIPEKMMYKNKVISLIDFQRPESDYIILESISREVRENKYMYLIKLEENKTIKLGRANDADVRMTDISVSRNHANIRLKNGRVYLEDNWSKFGSLVQMQDDLALIPNNQISIQCGKLHLLFNLTKTCYAWIRCYMTKSIRYRDYNESFQKQAMVFYQRELNNLKAINSDYTPSLYDSVSLNKRSKLKQHTQEDDHDEIHENDIVDSNKSEYAYVNLKGDSVDQSHNDHEKDVEDLQRYSSKEKGTSQLDRVDSWKRNSSRDNLIEIQMSSKEVNVTNHEYIGCETSYQPLIRNEYNNNSQTMNISGNTVSRPISAIDHLNKEAPLIRNYNSNKDKNSKEIIRPVKPSIPKTTKNKDSPSLTNIPCNNNMENITDLNEDKLLLNKFTSLKPQKKENNLRIYKISKEEEDKQFELITVKPKVNLRLSDDDIISEDIKSEHNQVENAVDNLFNDISHINNIDPIISNIEITNNILEYNQDANKILHFAHPKQRKTSNPEVKISHDDIQSNFKRLYDT